MRGADRCKPPHAAQGPALQPHRQSIRHRISKPGMHHAQTAEVPYSGLNGPLMKRHFLHHLGAQALQRREITWPVPLRRLVPLHGVDEHLQPAFTPQWSGLKPKRRMSSDLPPPSCCHGSIPAPSTCGTWVTAREQRLSKISASRRSTAGSTGEARITTVLHRRNRGLLLLFAQEDRW